MSERERFESWARQRWTHPEDFDQRIKDPGKYNNYEVQAAWDAWQERAAQPAPSVPEGWKLVPMVSTYEMDMAGSSHCDGYLSTAQIVWDAMLATAPKKVEQ